MDNLALFDPAPEDATPPRGRRTLPARPGFLYKDVFHAHLSQREPRTGLRGWRIFIALPGAVDEWPERVWSRQAAGHPPVIVERIAALAELGFELAGQDGYEASSFDPAELWSWQERQNSDGTVGLFATAYVRRIGSPAVHAAAVPAGGRCQCGSVRVNQDTAMEPPYATYFTCADCGQQWEAGRG